MAVIQPHQETTDMGIGNIVPTWWYHKVLSCGKPDFVGITVLSELWFLHRKNNGQEFNDGYIYFEKKFGLTRAQLQDAILRLHNAGLVIRSFRVITVRARKFPNELHLQLNIDKILALKPAKSSDFSEEGKDIFHAEVARNSRVTSSEKSEDRYIDNKEYISKE